MQRLRFLHLLAYRPAPALTGGKVRAYPVCRMETAVIPKLFPDVQYSAPLDSEALQGLKYLPVPPTGLCPL